MALNLTMNIEMENFSSLDQALARVEKYPALNNETKTIRVLLSVAKFHPTVMTIKDIMDDTGYSKDSVRNCLDRLTAGNEKTDLLERWTDSKEAEISGEVVLSRLGEQVVSELAHVVSGNSPR